MVFALLFSGQIAQGFFVLWALAIMLSVLLLIAYGIIEQEAPAYYERNQRSIILGRYLTYVVIFLLFA